MVTRKRPRGLLWLIAALAVFAGALWQQRFEHAQPSVATAAPVPAHAEESASAATQDHLEPLVPAGERDALLRTLDLIARGGPFPHPQDGSIFSNREHRLPARESGYYREYTVPTPGSPDRGARRVVQGRDGDTWYTSNHYQTFVRIDA
jgi:ribonuclease T1